MAGTDELRRTALYETHRELGGRIVAFGGWAMPIQYESILQEARAVRSSAGLFDVSHMGWLEIGGSGAAGLLSRALSVDAAALRTGRGRIRKHDCLALSKSFGNAFHKRY